MPRMHHTYMKANKNLCVRGVGDHDPPQRVCSFCSIPISISNLLKQKRFYKDYILLYSLPVCISSSHLYY